MKKGNVLEIKDLSVDFMTVRGIVYAVQGVDLEVKQGEIHGIVGESGCGKSVTSKSVIRLHNEETTRYAGDIYIRDDSGEKDVLAMSKKQLRDFRGSTAAMIFQDPMTSLDPIMKAGEQIAEMLRAKKNLNRREAREKVIEMFEKIGITPAEKRYEQYPFEMSGGMLQRIMIAMALICEPKLLIADEPTTALDVTIQAQILKLIKKLQQESGTSVIFITHNLGVVAEICDSVTVMYAGKAVETASVVDIFDHPAHPYTKALLESNPRESDTEKRMKSIPGSPPLLYEKFKGCAFDPKKTIRFSLEESAKVHKIKPEVYKARVKQLMEYIALPEDLLTRYPKDLSGGQLQRLAIARALMLEPDFILADEPVSALDVSVQAQILNLMLDLKEDKGQTILFISHDLNVVRHVCDRIAVVYLGAVMEMGTVEQVYNSVAHPYTQALISAKPKEHPLENKKHILLEGDIPNAVDIPEGCRFAGRCRYFKEGLCDNRTPKLKDIGNGHYVACHFPLGIDRSKTAADM